MTEKKVTPEASAAARSLRAAGIAKSTRAERQAVSQTALKARWADKTPEERSAHASKVAACITPEAATARALKSWETRRSKQTAK